ncbi:ImmA/IrrE family metallo-endopeptidase [Psychrobacillus sp. FSL K6-4046]|uniref:ImmA/IrrE family metallo-endopeptidase n=1 Tax=Psychrobacillus sp. FSL K6-4046 TaxID=2921550 RepID=UPI003159C465
MRYEKLLMEYPQICIIEKNLPKGLSGLYYDNNIEINKSKSSYEKHCILAEELGHYETTAGDITDLSNMISQKRELIARRWGYEKIVSLDHLVDCYLHGYTTVEEICLHLEITPNFLDEALQVYKQRYGISVHYHNYELFFDPLNISEKI